MPKLHQHQETGRYFTRIAFRGPGDDTGHIVTKQIHPDGVRWLKAQGTRLGGELQPSGAEFHLAEQGWLFTLGEVPEWGTIDWAPDWAALGAPSKNSYKEAAIRGREQRRQNQQQAQSAGQMVGRRGSEDGVRQISTSSSQAPTGRADRNAASFHLTTDAATNPYYARLLRELETGGGFLERCAESMYRLREPRNSQTIDYSEISPNKKTRNRQIAREVMTVAIRRVQDVTSQDEVEAALDTVAGEFYSHVAPLKSQTDPLEHRSDHAKAWYRQRARDFLYQALYPRLATGAASELAQMASPKATGKTVGGTATRPALCESVPSTRHPALQSTPAARSSQPTGGGSVAGGTEATADSPVPPSAHSGSNNKQAPASTAEIIGWMVILGIILLLVVLVLILVF